MRCLRASVEWTECVIVCSLFSYEWAFGKTRCCLLRLHPLTSASSVLSLFIDCRSKPHLSGGRGLIKKKEKRKKYIYIFYSINALKTYITHWSMWEAFRQCFAFLRDISKNLFRERKKEKKREGSGQDLNALPSLSRWPNHRLHIKPTRDSLARILLPSPSSALYISPALAVASHWLHGLWLFGSFRISLARLSRSTLRYVWVVTRNRCRPDGLLSSHPLEALPAGGVRAAAADRRTHFTRMVSTAFLLLALTSAVTLLQGEHRLSRQFENMLGEREKS